MGSCCGCGAKLETTKEAEYLYEGSLRNMKLMNFNEKNLYNQSSEKILLQPEQSPLREYSMNLFEKLNNIRSDPINYYNESVSYNVNDIIEILMKKKGNKESYALTWSTRKEREIIKILQNAKLTDINQKIARIKKIFEPDYEVIVFCAKNNLKLNDKESNEGLWSLFKEIKKMDDNSKDKIFKRKIDYFIIYSVYEDQLVTETETKTDVNNINNVVSFFFLFYYLQNQNSIMNFN